MINHCDHKGSCDMAVARQILVSALACTRHRVIGGDVLLWVVTGVEGKVADLFYL